MLHRLLPRALGAALAISSSAVLIGALAACGSSSKGAATPGDGEEIIIKKAQLGWGIKAVGDGAEVYLAITDEMGRATSHPLGRYDGECSVIPGGRPSTGAITAVLCKRGEVGVELDAIVRPGVIIVLKMGYAAGAEPDPLSGEEIEHIQVPMGAKIETSN